MTFDSAAVLAAYDAQQRSDLTAYGSVQPERVGGVVRCVFASGRAFVTAVDLVDGDGGDGDGGDDGAIEAAIDEQVRFFANLDGGAGRAFEWKVYGHDRPSDLSARLLAAGFEAEDEETLVIGATHAVLTATEGTRLPPGVRMREVTDETLERDVVLIADLDEQLWGEPSPGYAERLRDDKSANPRGFRLYLVETVDEPHRVVSAARLEMRPGEPDADPRQPLSDFGGLWGGGTARDWRGRGIYRALVRVRAEHAAAEGVRWLHVDASPDSRPILTRLGLHVVDWTQPHIWTPGR